MTGREDLYEQNGLAVQQQISDVLELVQNAKLPAPNVLLLRAYSSGCKAKGSDNMTGAMLKDLGAINIADADDSLLENLSMENIIADDPEDIFVVTMGGQPAESAGLAGRKPAGQSCVVRPERRAERPLLSAG